MEIICVDPRQIRRNTHCELIGASPVRLGTIQPASPGQDQNRNHHALNDIVNASEREQCTQEVDAVEADEVADSELSDLLGYVGRRA